jgi:hypothetical protein
MIQVHYDISFEIMSQRFNNDYILVEQGCASIKKNQTFLNFHSRNMVIFSKFLDFVMFGTRDLRHNGTMAKKKITISINYHICPISMQKIICQNFNSILPFIGPILTHVGPTSFSTVNFQYSIITCIWRLDLYLSAS